MRGGVSAKYPLRRPTRSASGISKIGSPRARERTDAMTTRDEILAKVRASMPPPLPLPDLPVFAAQGGSKLDRFRAALERMGGKVAELPADTDVDALVRKLFPEAKVVCSATTEVAGNRKLGVVKVPAELADVDVGIVRAAFGVAETGSVWLTE